MDFVQEFGERKETWEGKANDVFRSGGIGVWAENILELLRWRDVFILAHFAPPSCCLISSPSEEESALLSSVPVTSPSSFSRASVERSRKLVAQTSTLRMFLGAFAI